MGNDDNLNIKGSLDDVLKASTKPVQNIDNIGKSRQFGYFFNGTKSSEGKFYELPHEVFAERRNEIFNDPGNDYEFYAWVVTNEGDIKDLEPPLKGIERVFDKNASYFFDFDFDKKEIGELKDIGYVTNYSNINLDYHLKTGGRFQSIKELLLREQVSLELEDVDGNTWFRAKIDAGVIDSKGSFADDLLVALVGLYDMMKN